ncbi:MAG: hypothetical protein ONB23_02015 [candidate division KSB1 bacterium]|nr:hypothetical protein [candidate division KSB1 bacterium]
MTRGLLTMQQERTAGQALTRREFVATTLGAGLAAFSQPGSNRPPQRESLPTVPFGPYRISRLVVGGNPISGHSHWSPERDEEMMDYFSAANVKALLRRCEELGINTWQSRGDAHIRRLLREYRNEGGTIQWIAQTASEYADLRRNIRDIARMRPIAIYHHGSRTDRLWQEGQIESLRDLLKEIRDTGALVGVGSHIPEALEYVEERGWDVDFYMACFYNVNRRVEGKEAYLPEDRERMVRFIRSTPKPCLAFKVLAAGRNASTPRDVREAFAYAFANLKPNDAIVVGMFPKYKDEAAENAAIVRELLLGRSG